MNRYSLYRFNGTWIKRKSVQILYVQVEWYMNEKKVWTDIVCTGWMVHELKEKVYRYCMYRFNGTWMKRKNVQILYVQVEWYMNNERSTGWWMNEKNYVQNSYVYKGWMVHE